jgi:hypothetical protein
VDLQSLRRRQVAQILVRDGHDLCLRQLIALAALVRADLAVLNLAERPHRHSAHVLHVDDRFFTSCPLCRPDTELGIDIA